MVAEKHLRPNRHGEWAMESLPESQVCGSDSVSCHYHLVICSHWLGHPVLESCLASIFYSVRDVHHLLYHLLYHHLLYLQTLLARMIVVP